MWTKENKGKLTLQTFAEQEDRFENVQSLVAGQVLQAPNRWFFLTENQIREIKGRTVIKGGVPKLKLPLGKIKGPEGNRAPVKVDPKLKDWMSSLISQLSLNKFTKSQLMICPSFICLIEEFHLGY